MAKIIPFRFFSDELQGSVNFEIPVKRDNPSAPRQKEPVVISVMPEQSFPVGNYSVEGKSG